MNYNEIATIRTITDKEERLYNAVNNIVGLMFGGLLVLVIVLVCSCLI